MSPAAGVGVGVGMERAGRVRETHLGDGWRRGHPRVTVMVQLCCGQDPLLQGDSGCSPLFQPPALPRARPRRAGGQDWWWSSRYAAPPCSSSPCWSSSVTRPSNGECLLAWSPEGTPDGLGATPPTLIVGFFFFFFIINIVKHLRSRKNVPGMCIYLLSDSAVTEIWLIFAALLSVPF